MAWGDEGITKLLYKEDSVTNWGPINSPVSIQLIKSGILRNLRIVNQTGVIAFAGATTASLMMMMGQLTHRWHLPSIQQTPTSSLMVVRQQQVRTPFGRGR